jgi:hypothetical protein
MTVEEIYRLPVRTFWTLEANVGRLMAEEDLRLIRLFVTGQVPKAAEETARALASEMGTVVIENSSRDEEGFNRLRGLAKAKA